ncbi:hypothetical protein BDY17DRAFT_98553 [Neohortaea acidophila]|uniref:Uncharacterized protein n=1 Tax=Neohortaea acidophila TaxID=245834 RepID=A0A6A6PZJ2_9PEZI|nr:uncharacterized protein BDY17DRAFT_98553 [Neohortaea acidophila]KAF2485191.1 hypothetical protein BDY17DRAFT_98553 [Neohortaea acidophila]
MFESSSVASFHPFSSKGDVVTVSSSRQVLSSPTRASSSARTSASNFYTIQPVRSHSIVHIANLLLHSLALPSVQRHSIDNCSRYVPPLFIPASTPLHHSTRIHLQHQSFRIHLQPLLLPNLHRTRKQHHLVRRRLGAIRRPLRRHPRRLVLRHGRRGRSSLRVGSSRREVVAGAGG